MISHRAKPVCAKLAVLCTSPRNNCAEKNTRHRAVQYAEYVRYTKEKEKQVNKLRIKEACRNCLEIYHPYLDCHLKFFTLHAWELNVQKTITHTALVN